MPAMPEQLGFDRMPERLFVCTPSKLGGYEDCPRRYRFTYVDRPTPPKGPPWAHNSLGASVHTALRNWFDLPPARRAPGALPTLLRATWVREGYRDDEQERAAYRRALGWLEALRRRRWTRTSSRSASSARSAAKTRGAGAVRPGRPHRRSVGGELVIVDYKTGRTGLDADDARGSRALALYAFAAERVFRRPCRRVELHHLPTGTVAAHEHTDESLARHVRRAEETAARHRGGRAGAWPAAPTRTRRSRPRPGALCGWCDFRRVCPAGAEAPAQEPWAGAWQSPGRSAPAGDWSGARSRRPAAASCWQVGAQAPEGHLGLVDDEAVGCGRVQAGRRADRAVHVGDRAAAPADDVVVVVAGAGLVAGGAAGRFDPPGQAGAGQRAQHVVDGLGGDGVEALPDLPGDLLDLEVAAAARTSSTASRGLVTRRPRERSRVLLDRRA